VSNLYVARRKQREGLYIPMAGDGKNPNLMFFLPKMDNGQLDQYVRSELSKQGITDEATVNAIIEEAEKQYERRIKVKEAERTIKKLMDIKLEGGTKRLMQSGDRQWKEAWYPGVTHD
jgi:hypothetical protein